MDISGSPRHYPKLIAEKKHLPKVWGGAMAPLVPPGYATVSIIGDSQYISHRRPCFNISWCHSQTITSGVTASHIVASHITKLLPSFHQILPFFFEKIHTPHGRIPMKNYQNKAITCYGDPSAPKCPYVVKQPPKYLTFLSLGFVLICIGCNETKAGCYVSQAIVCLTIPLVLL